MTKLERRSYLNHFFVEGNLIKSIHLYDENGVIFSTGQGWFDSAFSYPFKDGLEVPDVKRRLKVNLKKKECFFVQLKGKRCELYLYVDGVDIKILKKDLKSKKMNSCEIWDYEIYSIEIKGVTFRQENLKEIKTTAFGVEVEKLKNELNDLNIHLMRYEIETILQNYDITKKRNKTKRMK